MRALPSRTFWMRSAIVGLGLAIAPMTLSAPAMAKAKPSASKGLADSQLAPLSTSMLQRADQFLMAKQTADAIAYYEAALVADPRNRAAYIGLGRASEVDGLPGRAIAYYREALAIDPNDIPTLEAQGLAYVKRGAKARAEENMEKLKQLCAAPCASVQKLETALAQAPSDQKAEEQDASVTKAASAETPASKPESE